MTVRAGGVGCGGSEVAEGGGGVRGVCVWGGGGAVVNPFVS